MILHATLLLLSCGWCVNEVCEDNLEPSLKNFDSLCDLLDGDEHHLIKAKNSQCLNFLGPSSRFGYKNHIQHALSLQLRCFTV